MGLDVYLYKYNVPRDVFERKTAEAEKLNKQLSRKAAQTANMNLDAEGEIDWDRSSKSQQNDYFEEVRRLREENGLDKYGEPVGLHERVELPSKIHPEHYFKIGYFRSSYNDGGINRVLSNLGLGSLSTIFPGEEYERTVDWPSAMSRALRIRDAYKARKAELGDITVLTVSHNMFVGKEAMPKSQAEALEIYEAELAKKKNMPDGFGDYSNSTGDFFWKHPFKATAMIPGFSTLGSPCVFLVGTYERTPEEKEEGDFYAQALDIVVETIEWVLDQPDQEAYILHWSG